MCEKKDESFSKAIQDAVDLAIQKEQLPGGLLFNPNKITSNKQDPLSIEMTPERWALGRSMNGYLKPPWTPPIPPEDLSNYKKRKESVVNSFLDGLIYFLEGFRQS